jgi:hypothetical protein
MIILLTEDRDQKSHETALPSDSLHRLASTTRSVPLRGFRVNIPEHVRRHPGQLTTKAVSILDHAWERLEADEEEDEDGRSCRLLCVCVSVRPGYLASGGEALRRSNSVLLSMI